jgi:hypothetical protein
MDLLSDEEVAEREALQERDELADKGFYSEPESDAIPPECERCGGSFALRKRHISEDEEVWSGATQIGDRWVCNDCDWAEWDEYVADLDQILNQMQEDEFSARRDEGEF